MEPASHGKKRKGPCIGGPKASLEGFELCEPFLVVWVFICFMSKAWNEPSSKVTPQNLLKTLLSGPPEAPSSWWLQRCLIAAPTTGSPLSAKACLWCSLWPSKLGSSTCGAWLMRSALPLDSGSSLWLSLGILSLWMCMWPASARSTCPWERSMRWSPPWKPFEVGNLVKGSLQGLFQGECLTIQKGLARCSLVVKIQAQKGLAWCSLVVETQAQLTKYTSFLQSTS